MDTRRWHAHYDEGVPPSIDYELFPISENLERAARQWPDRTALIFLNARVSYAQLLDQVRRFATALSRLGVKKDSKVAIHLPNIPQTVVAYYATLTLGAQAVMTNPLYVARELVHQWNDAEVEVAVTSDFLWERSLKPIREKLPVKHYVIASIPHALKFPLNLLAPLKLKKLDPPAWAPMPKGEGLHSMKELLRDTPADPPAVDINVDELAVLQYTGGTTGVSKAAMLSHRNLVINMQQCRAWMQSLRPGEEVILAALPYFHIFGMTVCMNLPVFLGASIVLMPNPRDIPLLIKSLSKHRVTLFPGVPAHFHAINTTPGIGNVDLTSVKGCFSGSAPLPEDTMRTFEKLADSVIFEGYGLTETSPASHVNPMVGERKVGTVGMPVPDTDSKIVDMNDASKELEVGEEGELLIRGPQVMMGYWKRPEETAEAIQDGWLFTGDLATMDADGYFKIVGRKKDMIIASGCNIYPDEIDRVLIDHPAVAEACTIGVPDPRRGETVKSFVVLAEGQSATAEELIAWSRENLAAYKIPRNIEFRDELPKSAMMKLLRRELRDEEIAKQAPG